MTLEQTALAEIQRVVDPEASEIDPIEPMNDGGWATAYRSGDRVFRLFYSPADGYEVFPVGEIKSDATPCGKGWVGTKPGCKRPDRKNFKKPQAQKPKKEVLPSKQAELIEDLKEKIEKSTQAKKQPLFDEDFFSSKDFDEATLTPLKGIASGHGNAGHLTKTTINGKLYFVKQTYPQEAAIEQASYQVARAIGVEGVVPVKTFKKGRKTYIVMPYLSEEDTKSIGAIDKLKKLRSEDVGNTLLYDYVLNNTDRHAGNVGVKNGKPMLFDHGFAFSELHQTGFLATPSNKLDGAVNTLVKDYLGYDRANPESKASRKARNFTFNTDSVQLILDKKDELIRIAKANKLDTKALKTRLNKLEELQRTGKVKLDDILNIEPPPQEEKLTDFFTPDQLAALRKKLGV